MWTALHATRVAAASALVGAVVLLGACSDGRPEFCDDLAKSADMTALTKALEAQDLDKARSAADQFSELAMAAPADIRDDFEDLAHAVAGIVDLLATERSTTPGAGEDGAGDAAVIEQQRDRLNRQLDELSSTSSKVERWASRECGLDLR